MKLVDEIDKTIKLWTEKDTFTELMERPLNELFELCELIVLITRYHAPFIIEENHPIQNFSFVANSSLSGGRHPCSSPMCRINKLNELVSFSSLYADEVYIQSSFESVYLNGQNMMTEDQRFEVVIAVQQYQYLRPLFKKGIIKYATNSVNVCHHHSEFLTKPLAERIGEKEEKLYHIFHSWLIERCSVSLSVNDLGDQKITIKGPEEIIDHGVIHHYSFTIVDNLNKYVTKNKRKHVFSKKEIDDEGLLSIVIVPLLTDLSNQEWHSSLYGTSYLCNNSTQIKLASKLNNESYVANSEAIENSMKHYLPTIFSKDIASIIKLRENEGEAFIVYRDKLTKLIKESEGWDTRSVQEIFRDKVLPEINLIEKKVNDWKISTRNTIQDKMLFGSGAVTIGLYSGILPPNIAQIVAAIGGGSAVVSALIDFNKTLKEKGEARSNDLYFLWEAKRI